MLPPGGFERFRVLSFEFRLEEDQFTVTGPEFREAKLGTGFLRKPRVPVLFCRIKGAKKKN